MAASRGRGTFRLSPVFDSYLYDAAGNLLFDGLNQYAYDGANRVLSVNGQSNGYVYDAEGNRVAKLGAGGTVQTVYVLTAGNAQFDELSGSGGWQHTNIYAPGGRLLGTYDSSTQPSPGYHYNLADWLGTKRMQTTANGNSQETCISNPYGDGLTCTGGADATEQHFTGKDHDTESNLDYFGARYYSEVLGRFMTPDWAAAPAAVPYAAYGDPQSLNLYAYVENSPIDWGDADGHCGQSWNDCALEQEVGYNEFQYLQELAGEADLGGDEGAESFNIDYGLAVGCLATDNSCWTNPRFAMQSAPVMGIDEGQTVLGIPVPGPAMDITPVQQSAIATAARDWSNSEVPYEWGYCTKRGADCSGSIVGIYRQAGINLPRLGSQDFAHSPLFARVNGAPQVGDVGVYARPHDHAVLYGGDLGRGRDVWSAFHHNGPAFGPAKSSWFGTPTWYRYVGP